MGVVGSIRKVTLDGVTFAAMASANIKEIGSAYLNDAIPTSGKNVRKMTKRADIREGIELALNGAERDYVSALADRTDNFPMSYETASGDVYRTVGWIEFESMETEEGKATIKMIPEDKWESFLA